MVGVMLIRIPKVCRSYDSLKMMPAFELTGALPLLIEISSAIEMEVGTWLTVVTDGDAVIFASSSRRRKLYTILKAGKTCDAVLVKKNSNSPFDSAVEEASY